MSPASTFTSTDWNTAKTVMVTGVEDSDMNDEFVTLSNDPSGANYDSVSTVDVKLNVTDNDSPGVNVSTTALTVREEDTTGNSYTLALNIQPTADVTVTVAGHSDTDVTPSPTTLIFTPQNWATAQDGDGDGRQRCGHGERFRHPDPQRDEHGQQLLPASRLPAWP